MKQMEGQLNLFTWQDEQRGYHYCKDCENAKWKERTKDGTNLWFCGKHHAFITEHSIDKYMTTDKCFERRVIK